MHMRSRRGRLFSRSYNSLAPSSVHDIIIMIAHVALVTAGKLNIIVYVLEGCMDFDLSSFEFIQQCVEIRALNGGHLHTIIITSHLMTH